MVGFGYEMQGLGIWKLISGISDLLQYIFDASIMDFSMVASNYLWSTCPWPMNFALGSDHRDQALGFS